MKITRRSVTGPVAVCSFGEVLFQVVCVFASGSGVIVTGFAGGYLGTGISVGDHFFVGQKQRHCTGGAPSIPNLELRVPTMVARTMT